MSTKRIPVIRIELLDFARIARLSDKQVYQHLLFVCRQSSKRIVPLKVRHDAFRVSRADDRVTIHLLHSTKETARASFVPTPSFNRLR